VPVHHGGDPLVGFQVGRKRERVIAGGQTKVGFTFDAKSKTLSRGGSVSSGPGHWEAASLDELGLGEWRAAVRVRGRDDLLRAVLAGPVAGLLASPQPLGFQITFRFGTLVLLQQHFAKRPEELDVLAKKASYLAGEIRRICVEAGELMPFDMPLPEPMWADHYRAKPRDTFVGGDGQDLGSIGRMADRLGMDLEDAFTFARGFCDVGIPGEPFGVLRGTLPETDIQGRIVSALERQVRSLGSLNGYLDHPIGGAFGSDAVMFPVPPDAPETTVTGVLYDDQWRYVIRRGILAVWHRRDGNQATHGEYLHLTNKALEIARSLEL
jgi:hypothetical protein